jgi:DtxR family Mn-dependent transcriptional regulator
MTNPIIALAIFFGLIGLGLLIIYVTKKTLWLKDKTATDKIIIEDVLKQLYHVENSGRKASITELAGALKVKDRRLIGVIEDMRHSKLITTEGHLLQLTDEGRAYALQMVRVHRLYEKYLSEKTGVNKLEWHDRAEKMEHKLSPEDIASLDRVLGSPRFDPHGDPIPTASGELETTNWQPLSIIKAGSEARIVHIEDEPETIYQQIIAQRLHVGSQLKVLEVSEDEVKFFCEGETFSFTPIVATNINVLLLADDEPFEEHAVRLSTLESGEEGTILGISTECRGAARRRLLDLGFITGTSIETELTSPMDEPRAYLIRNTLIALRREQSELILIEKTS